MKHYFILFFILFFSFCNSQITFNDLSSLAQKKDIPHDIFDLLQRKGYKFGKKEDLLGDNKCFEYYYYRTDEKEVTVVVWHCNEPNILEERFLVQINSELPKYYDSFLETAKVKGKFSRKEEHRSETYPYPIITNYYKISEKLEVSFKKYMGDRKMIDNTLVYFVSFNYK